MTHNPYAQFQQPQQQPAPGPAPYPAAPAQPAPYPTQPQPYPAQPAPAAPYGAPLGQPAYAQPAPQPQQFTQPPPGYGQPAPGYPAQQPQGFGPPNAPPFAGGYGQPAAAAPAYAQPAPAGFGAPSAGFASAQDADANAGMNLVPRGVFGRFICRIDGFAKRVSPSRGTMGGPQRVAKLHICRSTSPQMPVSATYDYIFRAGVAGGKAGEAVARDLGRCKQMAAAAFGLGDPNSKTPPLPPGCVVQPGQQPWDAILDHLELHRHDQQPLYCELVMSDSGNAATDPNTRQPLGYNYANASFLPPPPPNAG